MTASPFDHTQLSDRELLLLALQKLEDLGGLRRRVERLETWRTALAGGFTALTAWAKYKGGFS